MRHERKMWGEDNVIQFSPKYRGREDASEMDSQEPYVAEILPAPL